jgi:hypothetical protein
MGSDICICHYVFGNETESNIMSKNNEKDFKNSKDITEKPFFNKRQKNVEQDTLAEEKDNNNFHFGDVNSSRNIDYFEKPSSFRNKDDNNQSKGSKSFFNFEYNKNIDDSKKNNNNNIHNINNGINSQNQNNNNFINNNNSAHCNKAYKKLFTFKETNLKSTPRNIRKNDFQNSKNDSSKENEINYNNKNKNKDNEKNNDLKIGDISQEGYIIKKEEEEKNNLNEFKNILMNFNKNDLQKEYNSELNSTNIDDNDK